MSAVQDFYRKRYSDISNRPSPKHPTLGLTVATAVKAIGKHPKRILDFGCNVGVAAKLFTDAGHQVVGVDIAEGVIHAAQTNVPSASFRVIESEMGLPFSNDSFEVCFCSEVVEHLFAVRELFDEVYRILSPNGLFILTVPYHGFLKNLVITTVNFERHFNPTGGHIRFFNKRSLTQTLRESRFSIDNVSGIGRCWPFWKLMFVVAAKRR